MEIIDHKKKMHQPTGMKAKSVYRKVELLHGLLTIFGDQALEIEDEDEDEKWTRTIIEYGASGAADQEAGS